MSVFQTLNAINVNGHTEEKNGLTYLSWAWAWQEVKKQFPDAAYSVYRQDNGLPYVYDPNTGYMVFTEVTIEGLTHGMWLPVMDGANKAMKSEPYTYTVKNPYFKYAKKAADGKYYDKYGNEQTQFNEKTCEAATMFDVNKAIMRCLVKNLAMFGLGMYIYAGEDLPETVKSAIEPTVPANEEVEKQVAKDMCMAALGKYSKRAGKDNKTVNNELRAFIGKGEYNDFTAEDWDRATKEFESRK